MSVDLATLGIRVDSTEAETGTAKLDQLTAAGARAEGAVDRLGDTAAQAGAQVRTASQAAADMAAKAQLAANSSISVATNVGRAGTASGLAAHHVQNLAFQANDLFVGLASGQKPMTVFMQQGAQVAQIMAQAGIGVRGLAAEVGGMIARFARAHPVLVGITAAAAAATAVFKIFQSSVGSDAETKKLIASLGLTKKELKELENTGVTAGDTFRGLWTTISEGLNLGPVFEQIKEWASIAFRAALDLGKMAAAGIYAAFVGGFNAIKAVWSGLPGAIGEAVVGAANLVIKAVEGLINKAVRAFNMMLVPLNALLTTVGLDAVKPFTDVALPRIESAFAGSTARMTGNIRGEFSSAYGDAIAGMDAFGAAWERNTLAARDRRVRGQAAEIIGERPEKTGAAAKAHKAKADALTDEEKAYLAAMKAGQQYLDALEQETARIGKSAIELKLMEVAAAAAKAPTDELKLSIIKAGDAWVAATNAQNASDFVKNIVEPLEFENSLIGKSIAQQALLRAERDATAAGIARGTAEWERYMAATEAVVAREEAIANSDALIENLRLITDEAAVAGEALANAFGKAGSVLGGLLESLAGYQEARASLAAEVAAGTRTQAQADKALATLQTRNTAAAINGIKSLFKEHSAGYKVMQAVETAYAAVSLANTIKSIAPSIAAGASKIFSQLGVWGFPVVGAMLAVMAGLGFGGGGAGAVTLPPTSSEDLQNAAGTGTVLGDTAAKSDSIANSLEIVASNSNRDLEYTNQMLRSLRSIDTGIARLSGNIAKQISVSGSLFDTSKLSLGQTGSAGFLGLFSSSTQRSLYDAGINLNGGSVADILAGGITGNTYQTVEQIRRSSGFLGIGGGTRTTYETTTGQIDAEITSAIVDVIASLRDGLIAGADVIGLGGAQAILDAFQVNIGRISFAGLTGQEIEEQLNAIFSKVGDEMAAALLPSISALQLVGEGLFETFMRVAREYQVVDLALASIGKQFGMVGLESVAARDALVQMFGSLDDFVEQTAFFAENFLSEAERIAPVASAVREELARLGLSGITTRDQFKAAVLGLDLTTTAGQELYAALLAVAPAFDKVIDYADAANKALSDGFAATVKEFEGYAASLIKYRDSLRQGEQVGGNAYLAARRAFYSTAGLAAEGDAGGLAGLENAGKTFLTASRANATSLTAYLRDVASVANAVDRGIFAATETADYAQLQLDALNSSTALLASIDAGIANVEVLLGGGTPAIVADGPAATTPGTTAATNDEAIADLRAQLALNNTLLMQMAENSSALARSWSRLEGDGMLIRTDTDTPIQVETV